MIKKILKWCGIVLSCVALVFGTFFVTKHKTTSYVASAVSASDPYFPYPQQPNDVRYDLNIGSWGSIYSSITSLYYLSTDIDIYYSKKQTFTDPNTGGEVVSGSNRWSCISFFAHYYNPGVGSQGSIFYLRPGSIGSSRYGEVFLDKATGGHFPVYYYIPDNWCVDSQLFCYKLSYVTNSSMFISPNVGDFVVSRDLFELQLIIFDTNMNYAIFAFPCSYGFNGIDKDTVVIGEEYTYTPNGIPFDVDYEPSDNGYYQMGYNKGLADNQQNVYDNGYKAGKTDGYANGFNQGVLESNDYSFTSLMGSIIDAPVKTITGLLNFNILGINLLDFVLGLFSIALIVCIIRLTRGG